MQRAIDPRFPIGEFRAPVERQSPDERASCIEQIAAAPDALRAAVVGLDQGQLDTPYRDGGWTLRQVVHHLADSHINSYVRFKLTLTESVPTIKTYDEAAWAELADASLPILVSLDLLESLHRRWVALLRSLDEQAWERRLNHPEIGVMRLDSLLALYAWHGRHHIAHITSLREQRGW